ncbi:MAG: alpha/beta fold hydrolase [Candidatus Woesearchaeota archaeon]
MLDYLIALAILASVYTKLNIFLIKRAVKNKKNFEIIKGAEPYFLNAEGKKGVLIVHGFSGTAHELKELANFFNKKGLTVHAPLLSGHGTSPEHMFSAKLEDWIDDVKKALSLMRNTCDEIYIVGFSFGGNLATLVAQEEEKVKGIICLSTPFIFKYERSARVMLNTLKHIKIFQKKRYSKKVVNIYSKHQKITYPQIPLYAMVQMWKGVKNSRNQLNNITKPVLLIQSTDDDFVSSKSLDYAFEKVSSNVKEKVLAKDSIHALIFDKNRFEYYEKIYEFIQKN